MLELNRLYNMDCMEGMAQFPDKYFDLAIVDPPYGIGVNKINVGARKIINKSCDNKEWDNNIPPCEYFMKLYQISKNQIIWGANYFNCFTGKNGAIVWKKNNPLPTSSDCEIASCSTHSRVVIYDKTWTNYVNDKETNHPTEKPIALYKWLLHNYAKPGMKIIDSHAGSCSSVIAFLDFDCEWIAFEIDKDYYEAASKRIENHKAQLKLF